MLASHLVDCILKIPAKARVLLQILLHIRFRHFCIQSNRTFLFFIFYVIINLLIKVEVKLLNKFLIEVEKRIENFLWTHFFQTGHFAIMAVV